MDSSPSADGSHPTPPGKFSVLAIKNHWWSPCGAHVRLRSRGFGAVAKPYSTPVSWFVRNNRGSLQRAVVSEHARKYTTIVGSMHNVHWWMNTSGIFPRYQRTSGHQWFLTITHFMANLSIKRNNSALNRLVSIFSGAKTIMGHTLDGATHPIL